MYCYLLMYWTSPGAYRGFLPEDTPPLEEPHTPLNFLIWPSKVILFHTKNKAYQKTGLGGGGGMSLAFQRYASGHWPVYIWVKDLSLRLGEPLVFFTLPCGGVGTCFRDHGTTDNQFLDCHAQSTFALHQKPLLLHSKLYYEWKKKVVSWFF